MPGNPTITDFTRVAIRYIDDDGTEHRISQRKTVQVQCNNVLSTNTAAPGRPTRWKLRHVLLFYNSGTHVFRKRVVIGNTTNAIWSGGANTVTIDGVVWTREGRIGEKRINSA
jgi:hypothetical protein